MVLELQPYLFIALDLGTNYNESLIIIIINYCVQWHIDDQKLSLADSTFLASIYILYYRIPMKGPNYSHDEWRTENCV